MTSLRADDRQPWRRGAVRNTRPARAEAVLKAALHRFGLDQEIERYRFVLHWQEIVGEEIAKLSRPESLRNGHLRVSVPSSVWAQELSFYKPVIINRLRKFLGADSAVKDVSFVVDARKAGR